MFFPAQPNTFGLHDHLPSSTQPITPGKRTKTVELPGLQAQQELFQRMAVGERLARVLAHDFNNVFQSLFVHLQFAENASTPGSPAIADLQDAQRTAECALQIVRRLQLFCQSTLFAALPLDLATWLPQQREHFATTAGSLIPVGIQPATTPVVIRTDEHVLLEVIDRLITNAAEAMPTGGTILISTHLTLLPRPYREQHPAQPPERMVRVDVKDTGPGMPPDVAHHAFEPFYSASKEHRSAGFGLTHVYTSVRKMGGFVAIDSKPGEGTTVHLYLPACDEVPVDLQPTTPARAPKPQPAPRPTGNPRTPANFAPPRAILVVESDPIVREVASRCLAREGYIVHEAEDGCSALERYKELAKDIGLVMLEFTLPGMSGVELQAAIRMISPSQRFLFCSSFNSEMRVDSIASDPRIQLIPKPFSRADLLNTVELMIGRP
jgi:two-component system cell cycle sensor histidine kinase/response regulator CckA